MRRADRLFQIVQILRSRRLTTARQLAERLEVSERTVYRDIRDLVSSGVPIEGEAGVGYALRDYDLPPLMFSEDEVEALVFGARFVQTWGDPLLRRAASHALERIEAVLPDRLRRSVEGVPLFAPTMNERNPHSDALLDRLALLRQAARSQHKVRFRYVRQDGAGSVRMVRPLCLAFIGPFWLLSAWCELRGTFRTFRVERIEDLVVLESTFQHEPGKSLEDFLRQVATEGPLATVAERHPVRGS